ncbi:hypothetical protein D3C71_1841750 [compost metagenome]
MQGSSLSLMLNTGCPISAANSRVRSSVVNLPMYTASQLLAIEGLSANSRCTDTGRPVAWVVPLTRSSVYSVGPTRHKRSSTGSTGQRA